MWEKFYSKNGLAAKKIAKLFIQIQEGTKIPRVSDYSDTLSIGRGTVQHALRLLEEMKAIQLEARGHLGTFLLWKDNEILLEISGDAPLIGSMPLPYTKKYEGLATGIVEVFQEVGERANLFFMRGGTNRVEALRMKKCDYTVISKMTAELAVEKYPNLKILEMLGENTYVSTHKIFLADSKRDKVQSGMKIGIDKDSHDQTELALLEFADIDVQYIDVNYMQLFDKLHTNDIDATIWNADETRVTLTFNSISLQSPQAEKVSKDTSEAVILINGDREEEIREKWDPIDKEKILQIQKSVERGEKVPQY